MQQQCRRRQLVGPAGRRRARRRPRERGDGRVPLRRRRADRCAVAASSRVLALGLAAGVRSRSGLLQQGGRCLSWRAFFRVSEILLLLLAGGAARLRRRQADRARRAAAARRSSCGTRRRVLDDSGRVGGFVAALTGYRARPALLPLLVPRRLLGRRSSRCCAALVAVSASARDRRDRARSRRAAPARAAGARLAALRRMAAAHRAAIARAAVDRRRRLRVAESSCPRSCRCRPTTRTGSTTSTVFAQWAVLGRVVAVRHPVDVRRRAHVVRRVLSRRHADRGGEPLRTGPRGAALDEVGRLAVRRVRADDGLRPARQRLSVSDGDAARARRLDARRDRRRLRLRPRQARLVPSSVPRQRRVRGAVARGAGAFSRRPRRVGARTRGASACIRSTARRWCASAG